MIEDSELEFLIGEFEIYIHVKPPFGIPAEVIQYSEACEANSSVRIAAEASNFENNRVDGPMR